MLDEVAADEHPRAPQPCLAVNGQRPCIIVSCCSALNLQRSTLCIVCLNAHVKLLVEQLQGANLCLTLRLLMPPPHIWQHVLADASVTYMRDLSLHAIIVFRSRPSQWNAV